VTRAVWTSIAIVSAIFTSAPATAQDTIFVPPPDRIAIRDLKLVPAVELVPGVRVHTVIGATGSVSLGEFDSAGTTPLHHHTREQADFGLTGALDVTMGTRVEILGAGMGVIVPPEVAHSIASRHNGVTTALEFHTVRRPDLVPPRPTMTFPSAPEAATLPPGRTLMARIDSGDEQTLVGQTCTMRWRRVVAPSDLHPQETAAELFVYVVRGDASIAASGRTFHAAAGTLAIVPATLRHVELRPTKGDVAIVEFTISHAP
jgi:mannose-6-phosphate isomerase-like protein (cupin superfamily)